MPPLLRLWFCQLLSSLTGLSPWLGTLGTILTLTGTTSIAFTGAAGQKVVTSSFTVNAAGPQIAGVVVPAGAQSGPITVTTGNGTSAVGPALFLRAKTLATGGKHTVAVWADGTLWA